MVLGMSGNWEGSVVIGVPARGVGSKEGGSNQGMAKGRDVGEE